MKRPLLAIFLILFTSPCLLRAQTLGEEAENAGLEVQVDSTLLGRDIFSVLPENVVVMQSPAVRNALNGQAALNAGKTVSGYRIRLFLDSSRSAREASLAVMSRFHSLYPNIPVYRTFSAPNFKVSAGNLRTRVEAERLLRILKPDFPDAFIVRDKFRFPTIGKPDTSGLEIGTEIETESAQ